MNDEILKELRTGNFIARLYEDSVEVTDVAGAVSVAYSRFTAKGLLVAMAVENGNEDWLKIHNSVFHQVLLTVSDGEFFNDIIDASNRCIERHPGLYAYDTSADDARQEEILREQQKIEEAKAALLESE